MKEMLLSELDINNMYLLDPIVSNNIFLCSDGKTIFKKFHYPVDDLNYYRNLINQKNESIIFPKTIVLNNGLVYGILLDYIKGKKIKEISNQTLLSDFFKMSREFELDIIRLVETGVLPKDIHDENILYIENINRLKMFDTDLFEFTYDDYYKQNIYYSMLEFNYMMASIFLPNYEIKDNDLKRKYKLCVEAGELPFSQFIKILVTSYFIDNNIKLLTLGDFKENIARKRIK